MQVAPVLLLRMVSSATEVFLLRTIVDALLRCIASSNNFAVDVSRALFLEDYNIFCKDYMQVWSKFTVLTYIIEFSFIHIVLELFDQLLQLVSREVIDIWLSVYA